MSIITLELKDDSDLELLIAFAKRLNFNIINVTHSNQTIKKSPIHWLNELAEIGGVSSISEPSEWQKEIRMDKLLFGRE